MVEKSHAKNGEEIVGGYTPIVFCGVSMCGDFDGGGARIGAENKLFWVGVVVRACDDIVGGGVCETKVGVRGGGTTCGDGASVFKSVDGIKR